MEWIKSQAARGDFRVTQRAHQEMVVGGITLPEALEAVRQGEVLEHDPKHRNGACSLVNGLTQMGRPLHILCATSHPRLIFISVYEPKLPNWITPHMRKT